MQATIYVTYDKEEDAYYAFSPELSDYDVESGDGYSLPFALEMFFHRIESRLEIAEQFKNKHAFEDDSDDYEEDDVNDEEADDVVEVDDDKEEDEDDEIDEDDEYDDDEDYVDDEEIIKALTGLKLMVIAKCPLDNEERMYVNALNIMLRQHFGQKDKAGKDYYFHPMRVSNECTLTTERIVALLHDTVEDTDMTFEKLERYGFAQEIINGVRAVTRQDGESYADFIARAAEDEIGREVKIADLQDNMNVTRLADLDEKDLHRLKKYLHAWRYLKYLEATTDLIKD